MTLFKRENGFYYVSYYENKRRKVISTKSKSQGDALQFLIKFEKEKETGRNSVAKIKISVLILKFLAYNEHLKTKKTISAYKTTLRYFQDFFCDFTFFDGITYNDLTEYFQWRLRNSSIYQCRKDRINLPSFYEYSVDRGYAKENLIKRIKPFKIPERQPVFFSKEDFQLWLEHCEKEDIRNIAVAGMNTGMRLGELINLTWKEVNLQERLITLSNNAHITKSKRVRSVPINKTLLQLLINLKEDATTSRVFNLNSSASDLLTYVGKEFKKAVRKSGLDDRLHFHSLRHSFGSLLVQKGVSIYEVQQLLGHKDITTTQIYSHLTVDNLKESVKVLDE